MARLIVGACQSLFLKSAPLPAVTEWSGVCAARLFSVQKELGEPKRPQRVYFIYQGKVRPEIMAKNPGIPMKDVAKIVSNMYKNIDEAQRKVLREEANKLLQEYKVERDNWYNSLTDDDKQQLRKAQKIAREKKKRLKRRKHKHAIIKLRQESGKPKIPFSGYLLYSIEFWNKHKDQADTNNVTLFQKVISKQWNALPDNEKEVYLKEAAEYRVEYKAALKKWETKMVEEGLGELLTKKAQYEHGLITPKPKVVQRKKLKKKATGPKKKEQTPA